MAIQPLSDRVVLKRVDPAETVKGGIIIPDTAKEKPMEAEVVAVGEGKINDNGTRNPMSVKAGQKVLIGKYSGTEVKIDGIDHVIVREDEILAIVGLGIHHEDRKTTKKIFSCAFVVFVVFVVHPFPKTFRRHIWPSPSSMPKMPARRSCAA